MGARFPGCTSSGVPGGDILRGQGVGVWSGSHRLKRGAGGTGAPRSSGHGRLPACAPWDVGGDPWQQLGEEGCCHLLTPSWAWVRGGGGSPGMARGSGSVAGLQWVLGHSRMCTEPGPAAGGSRVPGVSPVLGGGCHVPVGYGCRLPPLLSSCPSPAVLTPGGPRRLGPRAAGRGRLARASQPRGNPEAPEDDGLAGAVALGAPLSCCPEVLTAPRGP